MLVGVERAKIHTRPDAGRRRWDETGDRTLLVGDDMFEVLDS